MKIIKTNEVYKRDQFFTASDVAQKCKDRLETIVGSLEKYDVALEPSAGTGSFFNILPEKNRVGIEIDENLCLKTPELKNGSFYDYTPKNGSFKYAVIGNPPFGTQSNEAVGFFNHAAKFAEVIAFIVPKTWKRSSVQNRLSLDFTLVDNMDLDDGCFIGRKSTTVKCCFQIWKRSIFTRQKVKLPTSHPDWSFLSFVKDADGDVSPPENPDFVMLAYGSNPGQISKDIHRWRPKSVHFIKANINKERLIEKLRQLDYSNANNSARQSSLGRGELVKLYKEGYGE